MILVQGAGSPNIAAMLHSQASTTSTSQLGGTFNSFIIYIYFHVPNENNMIHNYNYM